MIKYFDTFTGIGGFTLGIQKVLGKEAECIGYSEIDKYAIQIYEKQFTKRLPYCSHCWEQKTKERELSSERESIISKNSKGCINCGKPASLLFNIKPKNYGNITTINASELPDFDLLVGGFPCQAFSIAGKRGGFNDTRGTLFFDIARILKEKRPRNFILENVKGLLSHDSGRTFKTIIITLAELGYCVEWEVLNAKNFGVPQNRER
ncbi:MAG: DNA (cytosine-5-)-methyltransferase, partial [Candidatus Paceibacterota bacterium]